MENHRELETKYERLRMRNEELDKDKIAASADRAKLVMELAEMQEENATLNQQNKANTSELAFKSFQVRQLLAQNRALETEKLDVGMKIDRAAERRACTEKLMDLYRERIRRLESKVKDGENYREQVKSVVNQI